MLLVNMPKIPQELPVVGTESDQRMVHHTTCFQRRDDFAYLIIYQGHRTVIVRHGLPQTRFIQMFVIYQAASPFERGVHRWLVRQVASERLRGRHLIRMIGFP